MPLLPLTRGLYAQVDEDDYQRLKHLKWYAHFKNLRTAYAVRTATDPNVPKKYPLRYLHHDILRLPLPLPPKTMVDHINRDPLDCRKANLRLCTPCQNSANKGPQRSKNKTSKYKGVSSRNKSKAWLARFTYNKIYYELGIFPDEYSAVVAYNCAVTRTIGQFAYINHWTGPTNPPNAQPVPGRLLKPPRK